jgi:F-type H+-transporting ATPase subunit b
MIDEAKSTAIAEGQRLLGDARQEVVLEKSRVRDQLRGEVGALAIAGASQVLGREIDARAHADLIEQLAKEIERG